MMTLRALGVVLGLGLISAGAAHADGVGAHPIAQRGGAQTCNQDADCRQRLPRPRACPGGGQSVPTACCRMNYCGICWSDCPASGGRAQQGDGAEPLVSR